MGRHWAATLSRQWGQPPWAATGGVQLVRTADIPNFRAEGPARARQEPVDAEEGHYRHRQEECLRKLTLSGLTPMMAF